MNNTNPSEMPSSPHSSKLLVRGIHLEITDALRAAAASKTARLFGRNDHIVRLRVDLEHDKTRGIGDRFIAKGQIEIAGPDLIASVASDDAYKSLDLLVDKLDGLLRKRHGLRKDRRQPTVGTKAKSAAVRS